MKFCNHLFVEGFGGMGDAVVCEQCGLDKYPEAIPTSVALARLQGRIIKESHPNWAEHAQRAVEARNRREKENAPV